MQTMCSSMAFMPHHSRDVPSLTFPLACVPFSNAVRSPPQSVRTEKRFTIDKSKSFPRVLLNISALFAVWQLMADRWGVPCTFSLTDGPSIQTCLACHLFYANCFVPIDITELRNHHNRCQEKITRTIHSDFSVFVMSCTTPVQNWLLNLLYFRHTTYCTILELCPIVGRKCA